VEKNKPRYVELSAITEKQCSHCGYHNEVTESLLDIQSYWLGIDLVEFSCIECGLPFLTSRDVKREGIVEGASIVNK